MISHSDNHLLQILRSLKNKASKKPKELHGLGVVTRSDKIYLYYRSPGSLAQTFEVAQSKDGFNFRLYRQHLTITDFKKQEQVDTINHFHIAEAKTFVHLLYKKNGKIYSAGSSDILQFEYDPKATTLIDATAVVADFTHQKSYVAYTGQEAISLAYSADFKRWQLNPHPVLAPRPDHFDSGPLTPISATPTDNGIMLLYHSHNKKADWIRKTVGIALFDQNDPSKLLWRSRDPVWEEPEEWRNQSVYPIGVIHHQGKIIAYWGIEHEGIFGVIYSLYKSGEGVHTRHISLQLKKPAHNPILSPKSEHAWEAFNTFNPAAVDAGGKVHLLYRAQGYDYISVIGYAASVDGYHISERHAEPVYEPSEQFEYTGVSKPRHISRRYVSGGGYGGCEDPRLTLIGERLYMTYVAFDGFNPPRVALTSILLDDFLHHRFLWERPVLISPPGAVDKNAVIFPEKVNGKYVIMHRIYPDILIDFVDTLAFDGTWWLKGEHHIKPRRDKWDSKKIGAGAPPIKTAAGWLLIYQSVGYQDPSKYKIGAMLLDLADPTKVLHRSDAPILEPDEQYENEGFKSGVTYPCGAVVKDGTLFVYYGGADSYVCVATTNLKEFLTELQYSEVTKLKTDFITRVM